MTTKDRKHLFGSPYECHVYDLNSVEVVGSPRGIVGRTYDFEGKRHSMYTSKNVFHSDCLMLYLEHCQAVLKENKH